MDVLFTAAFHRSPIGQYLLAPTDKLEIIAVNDAFLGYVGRRREDLLGLPLFEAFAEDPGDAGDTGVGPLGRSIARAIETRSPQTMSAQRYPIGMTRDGKTWFEDRYWSATNTPIFDEAGQLICISHTTIDVTAEVLAQRALRSAREEAMRSARSAEANRAYLASVLRSAPVGIIMLDERGKLLHANPAHEALFGAALPCIDGTLDFAAWNGWAASPGGEGARLRPEEWPLYRALAGQTVDKCLLEVESFGHGRPHRMVLLSAAPIVDAAGKPAGATAIAMDIGDRVEAEKALIVADRRKDGFLAMLAHELRNPLAPISAAAALLSLGRRDEKQVEHTLAVIHRQVAHMSALVDELLDVARVTRGLITLDTKPLDMKRVVSQATEQARPALEARRHTLHVRQPQSAAFVTGDEKRLVQVIANLLSNAAKFTPEGGIIEVELAIDERHVRTAVTDNGIGLAADMIEPVFGMFVQGERSPDRKQGGLCIGLALVGSLVELHGGTVHARSAGAGRGTCFTVCLPLAEAPQLAAPAHAWVPPPGATALRVLAVDDNEDALAMVEMLLSSLGHRVISLASSRDAVRRAAELQPDVCLLDIGLPDIDGLTLARQLRADPRTRGAWLIGMSGYGQASDRAAAIEAGFDLYFVKPVDVGRLVAALAEVTPRHAEP
ncbi:ATP-binding protein [Pseudoduganella sp. SL102]|uniref:PAS domain-containing hybrid sensor histidine kinase/response regulator n=1 Tax=Pseudoduganella sp. SL102 TaxID=2995154 RepID=UPI00248BE532|nr:ATP-binding protein [Pseudoduganella sp. SL102]WBR99897.1 ATP-binding protein [Pseudoduganella sp. SL102]